VVAARRPAPAGAAGIGHDVARIRRATLDDHPWIVGLWARVYADLGDYRMILPSWLAQPGVLAWVDADERRRRGFAMLGFYPGEDGRSVADLLALGVDPAHQRRGIGRALLEHVIAVAGRVAPQHAIGELRLTVAHDNAIGQRMYLRNGFRRADVPPGRYAGGQRALRMVRPLP
jgi:ribosomal protein S18 acetylase RimI-like enzyme